MAKTYSLPSLAEIPFDPALLKLKSVFFLRPYGSKYNPHFKTIILSPIDLHRRLVRDFTRCAAIEQVMLHVYDYYFYHGKQRDFGTLNYEYYLHIAYKQYFCNAILNNRNLAYFSKFKTGFFEVNLGEVPNIDALIYKWF